MDSVQKQEINKELNCPTPKSLSKSPIKGKQKLAKAPTFQMRTKEIYDTKLYQQAVPVLENIQNMVEEQEIQDKLVNNYQRAQFENKQSIKAALSHEMNFLENKKYYGTNDPAKLKIIDMKKTYRQNKDYQLVKLREHDREREKAILAKKLKNPDYNSDHDILTRAQILTKLYTAGFNLKDLMTPQQRRQNLQQQLDHSNFPSLTDDSKVGNDEIDFGYPQEDQHYMQTSDTQPNLQQNTGKQVLFKQQTKFNQLSYKDQKKMLQNQQIQQKPKKVNFLEIEKQVEIRKSEQQKTIDNQELTSNLLQSLRQKMFKELFNPTVSVGKKFSTISNMFETELNEGKRQVYLEKIQKQREKQRQEMLSRQQAFNSFYNLMALNKNQKKKISEKQKQEFKLKKLFNKLSNNNFFKNNNPNNTLNQKNKLQDKQEEDDDKDQQFSRFNINSQSVCTPNVKNVRSKVLSGLSHYMNRELHQKVKSNPKVIEYSNPYNNQVYKSDGIL